MTEPVAQLDLSKLRATVTSLARLLLTRGRDGMVTLELKSLHFAVRGSCAWPMADHKRVQRIVRYVCVMVAAPRVTSNYKVGWDLTVTKCWRMNRASKIGLLLQPEEY